MNVFISRNREYEFGIAFGISHDWIDEYIVKSIRFSFAKRSVVFVFRKGKK